MCCKKYSKTGWNGMILLLKLINSNRWSEKMKHEIFQGIFWKQNKKKGQWTNEIFMKLKMKLKQILSFIHLWLR